MSTAYDNDKYDPYRIDSIQEVDQILLEIIKKGILLRMHSGNPNQAVITTLVDINIDDNELTIDSAAQEAMNKKLLQQGKAYLEGVLDNVTIQFQVDSIIEGTYKDHPALISSLPTFLRRLQRRDSFRVQPSSTSKAICTLNVEDKIINLQIFDISASGVSVLDAEHALEKLHINKGHIFKNSELVLPGVGSIVVDLELVRQQTQGKSYGKEISRYGYAFFSFNSADKIRVQHYINQEERLRIARERSLNY